MNTCERDRRSCPQHAVCSVLGTEGIKNICMGTAGSCQKVPDTAAHSRTLHKLPPQVVITVWAVSLCPRDTLLGPGETIFYLLHRRCWQGDSKLQDSLQSFILSQWGYHPSALGFSSSQTCTDPYSYVTTRQGLPWVGILGHSMPCIKNRAPSNSFLCERQLHFQKEQLILILLSNSTDWSHQ